METPPPRTRIPLPCLALLLHAGLLPGADCNQNGADDAEELRSGAVSDCNRNGLPDSCDLVLRAGTLEPASSAPTGAPRDGPLRLADFDGDGRLEAIAGHSDSRELRIHRGEPAGFGPGTVALAVRPPAWITAFAAADLTGEGLADVVLLTSSAEGQVLELRRSTGAGFAPPEPLPGPGGSTYALLAEDLDGDGRPEVIETAHNQVRIHWNDGGVFGEPVVFPHFLSGYRLEVLDPDGDGDLDLVAAADLPLVELGKNLGPRSFSPLERHDLPAPLQGLAAGDLDGDRDSDLVLGDPEGDIRLVSLVSGTFTEFARFTPRAPVTGLLAADLDGDGGADPILLHGDAGGEGWWVEVRRGADGFLVHPRAAVLPGRLRAAAAADVDGDADVDLIALAGGDYPPADSLIVLDNRPAALAADGDADGVPDGCRHPDCNGNGSPDAADIAAGTSLDCDADALPDECEPDCNADGEADDCDLERGESLDRDGNAIPDECESLAGDCDLNGIADRLDLDKGSADCDGDRLLDACEIAPEILLAADFRSRIGLRSRPGSMAAADLDGDGDLDAAFAGRAACGVDPVGGSVEVVLNLGQGHLVHAGLHALEGDPVAIAAEDFEGDGDEDLAVIEGSFPCRLDARASVLLNRGRGTFDRGPRALLPAGAESFAAADLDGDGRLDLAVANPRPQGGRVLLLRSRPEGGFAESEVGPPGGARVVVAGDLDGDRILDLAAGGAARNDLFILPGSAGGGFPSAHGVTGDTEILSALRTSDLDGDRDLDLVSIEGDPLSHAVQLRVRANDGAGRFAMEVILSLRVEPSALEVADLDGDSRREVLVFEPFFRTEYGQIRGGFLVFEKQDGGLGPLFGWGVPAYLGASRFIAAGGDWNQDGAGDLLVADTEGQTAAVLHNSGTSPYFFIATQVPAGTEALDLEAADLDGDGDPDLASVDAVERRLWIVTNDAGALAARPSPAEVSQPRALSAGDLDGDGDADLALAGPFAVLLAANAGGGSFPAARSLVVGSNPLDVALSDLDGDGDLDLATANSLGMELEDNVTVFRNLEGGRFDGGHNFIASHGAAGIEAVDMDADGDADLLVSSGTTVLLRNRGDAAFASPEAFASGSFFLRTAAGDIDGDGYPDLIAPSEKGVHAIRNRGDGRPLDPEPVAPYARRVMRLVDLDLDRDLDLAFLDGYGEHWLEVLRNDGRGSFAAPLAFDAGQGFSPPLSGDGGGGSGSSPAAAAIAPADFDGDGDPDLALGFTMRSWLTIAWNRTRAAEPDVDGDGVPDSCAPESHFRRGDGDQNGKLELTDAVRVLRRLFLAGEPLACEKAADADDDGRLNLTDAVRILGHLFLGDGPPPAPYPACGPDPSADPLACRGACR